MAGQHIYSSSKFIQSGSIAQFKSGITASGLEIQGPIFAGGYFDLSGNPITTEGNAAEFFAGSGSGISASTPTSIDHFFTIDNTNKISVDDSGTQIDIIRGDGEFLNIQTTGSINFKPNFFNFLKVGDLDEDLITVQQGGIISSSYTPNTISERKPGVHRYIVYAAETGSSGKTHQVFHTITLDAFSNNPPTLIIPTSSVTINAPAEISLDHDEINGNFVLHFTNSFDQNQLDGEDDFIRLFKTTKTSTSPTIIDESSTQNEYGFDIKIENNTSPTELEITEDISPGLSANTIGGSDKLHFTASITNYNTVFNNINLIKDSVSTTENFEIKLEDNFPLADPQGITNGTFNLIVNVPPTASISETRITFEGNNNEGGFSSLYTENVDSNIHKHTLLYDNLSTYDSTTIQNLNDRYTSSLVRIKAMALIEEPPGHESPGEAHDTKILFQQANNDGDNIIANTSTDPTLKFFRFKGGENTASFLDDSISGDFLTPTENNGFTSFVFTPSFTNRTQSIYLGTRNDNETDLNRIGRISHADNNHYKAIVTSTPSQLDIYECPEILIEDIEVEIEDSYQSNTFSNNKTTSLLTGLTSSIGSEEISDLFNSNNPSFDTFVAQSIIRFRLKAKITEPFGPAHNTITAKILLSSGSSPTDPSIDLSLLSSPNIELNNASSHVNNSLTGYTTEHNGEGSLVGKELLVSSYTSSVFEIKIPQGTFEFIPSFTSSSNAGSILSNATSQSAIINMNAVGNIKISNVKYEVETLGESNIGTDATTRTVLYGDPRTTNATSSGTVWETHDLSLIYAQTSVTRFRAVGTITEPFGTEIGSTTPVQITQNGNNVGSSISVVSSLTPITNTGLISHSLSSYNDSNELVTNFTSSWIGSSITATSNGTSTHTISGVYGISHTLEGPITTATLTLNDTPPVAISNAVVSTETFGYSGVELIGETSRTVLYGDNKRTNDGTGSSDTGIAWGRETTNIYPDNISDAYASQSVSRLRRRFTVTEPIGFAHNDIDTNINLIANDGGLTNNIDSIITINTKSAEITDETYVNNQLTYTYDSGFIGVVLQQLDNGSTTTNPTRFTYTLQTSLDPSISTENGITLSTPNGNNNEFLVLNTPPTEITELEFITEDAGFSDKEINSTERTVLYGENRTTTADISNFTGHNLETVFKELSVTRFKVKLRVTEPVGYAHHNTTINKSFACSTENNLNSTIVINKNHLNAVVSGDGYNSDNKFTYTFDSGFIGQALSTSNNLTSSWTFTGTTTHNPSNEHGSTSTNGSIASSTIIVKDTPPTDISDVEYETETLGMSGIPSTNTSRVILYGDPHTTNISNNSSDVTWHSHTKATAFTEASVTRFRVKAKITEPIGYLHSPTTITTLFDGPVYNSSSIILIDSDSSGVTNTLVANRQIHTYNSEFIGSQLTSNNQSGDSFTFTGSIDHNPENENESIQSTGTNSETTIIISDTPDVIIDPNGNGNSQTETAGNSGIGTNSNETRTLLLGESTTRASSTGLTSTNAQLAVTRFRTQPSITEPLGFKVGSFKTKINLDKGGTRISTGFLTLDQSNNRVTSGYNENNEFVTSYRTEFSDGGLQLTAGTWEISTHKAGAYTDHYAEVTVDPGENGITVLNENDNNSLTVNNASQPSIDSFEIFIEEFSGSNSNFSGLRTSNILHGNSSTETNQTTNATYPVVTIDGVTNAIQKQLVSARVVLTITQPPIDISDTLNIDVTINGQSSTNTLTLNSDSDNSDVESVSTSGDVTTYTSAFIPLRFDADPETTEQYTITATITNIEVVGSSFSGPSTTTNSQTINVVGADSSTITAIINTGSGFQTNKFMPTDTTASIYYAYPTGSTTGYSADSVARTFDAATVIATPPDFTTVSTLTIGSPLLFSYTASNRYFDFNSTITNFDSKDTGNTTPDINIARPSYENSSDNNANSVRSGNITITVVDPLIGNGRNTDVKTLYVIPAPPIGMGENLGNGKWGGQIISAHSVMQNDFYTGLLARNAFEHYENDTPPTNTNHVFSDRIIYTKENNLPNNYNITIYTHPNNTATFSNGTDNGFLNYLSNNNLAFDKGDKGNIILKVNGEVAVDYSLTSNFDSDPNSKIGDQLVNQVINFTGTYSGKGNLTITKVSPFNGVYQAITGSDGYIYPNGFQGWNASINLTDKLRDGYNFLELSHSFNPEYNTLTETSITPAVQSLEKFDFYYNDDLIDTASIGVSNYTSNHLNLATHSISGVSYFKMSTNIPFEYRGITNVANNVYPVLSANTAGSSDLLFNDEPILKTQVNILDNNLTITGDNEQFTNNINHFITDFNLGNNLRRGLRFTSNEDDFVPTDPGDVILIFTASYNNTSITGVDRITGKTPSIKIFHNVLKRDTSDGSVFALGRLTTDYNFIEITEQFIGRFMEEGSNIHNYVAPTPQERNFFTEEKRWKVLSLEDPSIVTQNRSGDTHGYSFFLTSSNADYDSTANILATTDLQQTYEGKLIYPSANYNSVTNLPNSVNYTGAAGNRYYYTALQLDTYNSSTLSFQVRVHGDFIKGDIYKVGGNINDTKIRVDIKIPGPISDAGSGWSNIGHKVGGQENTVVDGWNSTGNPSGPKIDNSTSTSGYIQFNLNTIDRELGSFADGVVLFRIRYKDTVDEHISKIEIAQSF